MHRSALPVILVAIWATGCSLDGHMNCPLGFVKSTEMLEVEVIPDGGGPPRMEKQPVEVCIEPFDTGPTVDSESDTGSVEEDSDTADAGDDGGNDTAVETGLMLECFEFGENQEPCINYEADFCAFDPFAAKGYCTYENCTAESCPEVVKNCCDCNIGSDLIWGIACLEDGLALAAKANGCTCTTASIE